MLPNFFSMCIFACWVIFHDFGHLLTFYKINFLSGIPLVSKSVNIYQDHHFVRPNLGPDLNLQRLSADETNKFSLPFRTHNPYKYLSYLLKL